MERDDAAWLTSNRAYHDEITGMLASATKDHIGDAHERYSCRKKCDTGSFKPASSCADDRKHDSRRSTDHGRCNSAAAKISCATLMIHGDDCTCKTRFSWRANCRSLFQALLILGSLPAISAMPLFGGVSAL